MTKEEAALTLKDRYEQISSLAETLGDGDPIGAVLKALMDHVPEAIDTFERDGSA